MKQVKMVVDDDTHTVTSVGNSLGNQTVYNTSHPAYQKIASLVTQEVAKLADRDAARKMRSMPVVMTVVLDSMQTEALYDLYPEMKIVNYGFHRPGHSFFSASLVMANELLLLQASKMATTVVHLGGSLMSSLLKDDMDVHIELNPRSSCAVFARQQDTQSTARVMSDYAQLAVDVGANNARVKYENYIRGTSHKACVNSSTCTFEADAYCADLASCDMSLTQFCAGMRQCGASVGMGFFIYHPVMLLAESGELPGTGIHFSKSYDAINFRYPEGVVGVESYSLTTWSSLLTDHVVHVGTGTGVRAYHMQLGKARGCFMFLQVTEVPVSEHKIELRHVLDLPLEDQYAVSAWSLRDLASDPGKLTSWEKHVVMVPEKVVNKLFEFGMQLSPTDFGRYALRKQLSILDRVTIEGSIVTKGFRPNGTQTEMLVNAMYAHCFVKRFESGQLSKALMERLKLVSGFGTIGFVGRVAAVASWAMMNVWDYTFGMLGDAVTSLCEWIERMFAGGVRGLPTFELAPTYISMVTVTEGWRINRGKRFELAVDKLSKFGSTLINSAVRGGMVSDVLSRVPGACLGYARLESVVVSAVPLAKGSAAHTKHVEMQDLAMSKTLLRPVMNEDNLGELQDALVSEIRMLNEMDEAPVTRHYMPTEQVVRSLDSDSVGTDNWEHDPDYIGTMNEVYEEFNPGVAQQPLYADIASLSYDDQDRYLVADFLRLPRLMDTAPKDREYYVSKVLALGSPKRQETAAELLSAAAARTLAAPKLSLPQDNSVIVPEIWDRFLKVACVDGAQGKLDSFSADLVGLEETSFRDWMSQSKPEALRMMRKQLQDDSLALAEMDVGDYMMMLKADVKPTLSDKPLRSRTEPQVIVYHMKAMSAMYSSLFRVLVRRFLSLLKPEFHVNLLKDTKDIGQFIAANHPFGSALKFLENDFSKYDKSQDAFAFELEEYIFRKLGMNEDLLQKWVDGHVECSIRSITTGISLHVRYQRKSGDATTAAGNVFLNVMSVVYAYSPSDVVWAVFMGDDSIVACRSVGTVDTAVDVLAEVFNLTAKMYITDAPYFASHFICIDEDNGSVAMVPDPIKFIEKRSQPVSAVDPLWQEKYASLVDTCGVYLRRANTVGLGRAVSQRYPLSQASADRLPSAIATCVADFSAYRNSFEQTVTKFWY